MVVVPLSAVESDPPSFVGQLLSAHVESTIEFVRRTQDQPRITSAALLT